MAIRLARQGEGFRPGAMLVRESPILHEQSLSTTSLTLMTSRRGREVKRTGDGAEGGFGQL